MGRTSYLSGLFGLSAALLCLQASAQAQEPSFPARAIKIISASPAGGGVDLSARIVADQLQKLWGHPTAPAVNDLAGGHVDTMFCDLGTILPLHQVGKVRIIAVASLTRLSQIPAIPTIDESGVKGFSSSTFFSLMAPPKTPPEIRAKLNKAIVAAMQTPEVQAKLKLIFVEASNLDTKEMGEFVKAEAKLWGDVIRAANITVEQ